MNRGKPPQTRVTAKGRVCTRCLVWKPWDKFSKHHRGSNGHSARCKDCYRLDYRSNRESILKSKSVYRAENRNVLRKRNRKHQLKRLYGLSVEEFDKLFLSQGKSCAICARKLHKQGRWSGKGSRKNVAHVDHDHNNGEVRGILCGDCNWAIALLNDDPSNCIGAANYLEQSC